MKTSDHVWTDPHADELVQRHRMHSNNRAAMMMHTNNSLQYRPSLQMNVKIHHERFFFFLKEIFVSVKTSCSSSGEEAQKHHQLISVNPAREYVESLHQNAKSQLIYGKNNVFVQPVG